MSLVELHRFYTQVEADLARLHLANAGIESVIFDGSAVYVSTATGVRLMVDEDDLDDAKKLLEL